MQIKLFGCTIKLSFPLVAALTIVFIMDQSGAAAVCCFAALLHELGHLCMMALCKTKTNSIKLSLFDINITDSNRYQRSLKGELCVILAGAAANVLAAAAGYVLSLFFGGSLLLLFICSNIFLALFNLLPVEALDGGNAVYLILMRFTGHDKAVQIVEIFSFFILLPLACIGFYILLQSHYNFTLLFTSCYLMGVILLKKTKPALRGKK